MTPKERLQGRINLLTDLGGLVDEVNDMIYIIPNRWLDMSLTELKWLTKPRFTTYLSNVQESFVNFNP